MVARQSSGLFDVQKVLRAAQRGLQGGPERPLGPSSLLDKRDRAAYYFDIEVCRPGTVAVKGK